MSSRLRVGLCLVSAAALALGVASASSKAADSAPAKTDSAPAQWNVIQHYCTDCHNVTDWAGGVAFDAMSPDEVPSDAKVWEDAIRKLQGKVRWEGNLNQSRLGRVRES